jgi:hypothetical protein
LKTELIKINQYIEVTCYSGNTYAERPVSFVWNGQLYRVVKIEKEWQEPDNKHFIVNTDASNIFELCYNVSHDVWSLKEIA